jgi:hypothetical protein
MSRWSLRVSCHAPVTQVCQHFTAQLATSCVRLTHLGNGNAMDNALQFVVHAPAPAFRTELIARFVTPALSPTLLFTDSEALEMHARPVDDDVPLAGNYHACVASCYLATAEAQVSRGGGMCWIIDVGW